MSDAVVAALIVSIAPTAAVVLSGWINWRVSISTHSIVNSQRTEMIALIDKLQFEIAALKKRALLIDLAREE